jgi:hypothetical protein
MAQYKQVNFFSTTGNGSERLFSKSEMDWDDIAVIVESMGFDVEDVREFGSPDGRMNINIYFDCGD